MRFLTWLIVGAWLVSAPAFADDMTLLGVGGRSGAASYVGLGDIASGWTAYASCARSFSAAYAAPGTNPACDVRRIADSQVCTIVISPTGFVDLTATPCTGTGPTGTTGATTLAQFLTSTSGAVSKAYNQAGGGVPAFTENAGGANTMVFTFNAVNGLPCMMPNGTTNAGLNTTISSTAQPLSLVSEAERTGTTTVFSHIISTYMTTEPDFGFANSANTVFMQSGTFSTVSGVADNAPHSFQGVFNGASSLLTIDGTDNSISLTNVSTSTVLAIGNSALMSGASPMTGYVCETGMIASGLTGPQRASIAANMAAVW